LKALDKSKIVLVHYSSSPGGIEVTLSWMIKRLPQYSFSAFIIRPYLSGKPDVYSGNPVMKTFGSFNNISAAVKLFAYALRNRRSVFHVFNIGPVFLLTLRLAGIKSLIYSIHGTQYWRNGIERVILRSLWRLSLSDKYIITANSEFSKKVFLSEVFSGHAIKVLYNPIDFSRFKLPDARMRSTYPRRIIYCGRLDKEKNLDEWIRMAISIQKQLPDIVFEMYGDGSERTHLENLIAESGIGNQVILRGHTPEPEKVMQEADLMIFLSRNESFGNVVVESILCGTPVIAYDIPAMREIFRDFPIFLINQDANFSEAIMHKIKDFDQLNRSAFLARESFMARFSPHAHLETLTELYNSL
jgi:glycosyltransferase involved in cell wall biosynthesis